MDLGLKGKKAFLAGSSRGLGYAAARLLALEGCQIVINGRDEGKLALASDNLQAESGTQVKFCKGDASVPEQAEGLIRDAARMLGGLDLLMTNTGGPPAGKFEDLTDKTWQQAIDLALMSHVHLIRAALPYLRDSQSASVLTITSYSVKQPIPSLILSNSVRAATAGLTKSLAQELGSEGIRFNSLLPGWTKTERVLEIMKFRAEQNGTSVEDEIGKITAEIPLGRMAEPEEIGRVAAFLLSPAASYINGVMLTVGGGIYKGTL